LPRPVRPSLSLVLALSLLWLCSLASALVLQTFSLPFPPPPPVPAPSIAVSDRLPTIPFHLGYECILLFIHFNYIHFFSLKSRTAASYVTAYRSASKFFLSLSHPLTHIQINNEISSELTAFFQASQPRIHFQCVPPNNHRANKAERSIRTGKNHFLSVLSSAHITFPPDRWCDLLPATELILNTMRHSALDPSLSAWHGLHGSPVDFSAQQHPAPRPTRGRPRLAPKAHVVGAPRCPGLLYIIIAVTLSLSRALVPLASLTPSITFPILSSLSRIPPLTLCCLTPPPTAPVPPTMA
jgi:hypothetical protein